MESIFPILQQHNITPAEYLVMCTVGYHIFLPPAELAQVSQNLAAGDTLGEFTLAEYLQATASCLAKKWLEMVTQEQYQQMVAQGQAAGIPEIFDYPAPQTVDFTPQGYTLFRQVIGDIFGEEHLQQADAG